MKELNGKCKYGSHLLGKSSWEATQLSSTFSDNLQQHQQQEGMVCMKGDASLRNQTRF
jgi:hypothetical protein